MKYMLLLFALCTSPALTAAPLTQPLQIAQRFVAKSRWPQMKNYLCCEAAQQAKSQTLGQQIPPTLKRKCQLISQDSAKAVVAVELRDEAVSTTDFYLHFAKEDAQWKLQAVRGLAMTALGHEMLKLMEGMPPAEVAKYDQNHPDANHHFTVSNLKLWVGSDADIIGHFNRHQAQFNEVVRLAQEGRFFPAELNEAAVTGEKAANENPRIKALLRDLYIRRLTRRDTGCPSCLEFVIGGVNNNTVGLLYQPDAAEVPEMHPGRIIVIKPLGDGWYLYKTT